MKTGTVAIVGRPNVGKSTIFNRLAGERISIVEDIPGVTRDRIYASVNWLENSFKMIDTGGIQLDQQPYQTEINAQVEIAIEEADVIIFLVSAKNGLTDDDRYISTLLRRADKPVILAVNMVDDTAQIASLYEFYALGMGEPIACSGAHGVGIGDVLDAVVEQLPVETGKEKEPGIRIAVIGQPNVGKSSLVNAILKEDRSIVSDEQGTTRDAVDSRFEYEGRPYIIVDTAGIRKRGKVYESIEKYSVLRAMQAIEKSDVTLFLIDAEKGIREQDKHVAGYASEAGKPIIIVVNKWDLIEKDNYTMNEFTKKIRNEFAYLSYAPILFISAKTGQRVSGLIPLIDQVYENSNRRIATNVLNEVIAETQISTPAPARNGKKLRIYYVTQVSVQPPTFVFSCNDPELMHFSYQRFLENQLREAFDFSGTPMKLVARRKISE